MPTTLGRKACEELFDNFAAFVNLTDQPGGDELVSAVNFQTTQRVNSIYYFDHRKSGEANPWELGHGRLPGTEDKDVIHFGSQTIKRSEAALNGSLPAEMRLFLENCDEVYEELCRVARVGASALGIEKIMFGVDRDDYVHHLRLLHYPPTSQPTLGEPHFDRSWLTIAAGESAPGLRGAPGQNGYLEPVTKEYLEDLKAKLAPIDYVEFQAKFFAGAGLNRGPENIRSRYKGTPLLAHDIVNLTDGPRDAVVGFYNPHAKFKDYEVPSSYETGFGDIVSHIQQQSEAVA